VVREGVGGGRRERGEVCCKVYIYIYIIYTPNLGLGIAVSVQERGQGRFRGSSEGGAAREPWGEHGGAI